MRQRRILAALLVFALVTARWALADAYDPPAGYYNGATGSGATLKSQLNTIMSTGHILRTYGNFRDSAAIHDADPNIPGNILLVYNRVSVLATWDLGNTWDREHIWPQSLQGGGSVNNNDVGARADPFALRPCNPSINGSRGNKPFGFDGTTGSYGAVESGYYFPGDADKGDAARSLFYSDVRWGPSVGLSLTDNVPGGFQMGDLSSLVAWNYLDAPDEFERRRNQAIYSQAMNPNWYTNNRNAFIDRPELVWSIYMDQANDSQISIAGSTIGGDGSSTRNVDLGRVFVGDPVPTIDPFSILKGGDDGTYYQVTTAGDATSSITGRHNAFRMGGTDSDSIDVGLNSSTATAGLRSGSVTIDNLDVTTAGGAGRGANDANDTINVSFTVLDHSTASFDGGTETTSLVHDFGQVIAGSAAPFFGIDVFNFETTPGFTADMDFDSFMASGDAGAFTTDFGDFAGTLSLEGGEGEGFSALLDTATPGSFSATYTLQFSDEDLPGAMGSSLTLTLMGEVLAAGLPGDYNDDGMVDTADYIVWRFTYGESVPDFSGADGDGDGQIGDGDHVVWAQNYGAEGGGSWGGVSAAVPEPASVWLAVVVAGCNFALSRKRRGRG